MIRKPILVWALVGIGAFLFVETSSARERLFQRWPRRQKAVASSASACCQPVQATTEKAPQDEITAAEKAPQAEITAAEKAQLDALLKTGQANGRTADELKTVQDWWHAATPKERAEYFAENSK